MSLSQRPSQTHHCHEHSRSARYFVRVIRLGRTLDVFWIIIISNLQLMSGPWSPGIILFPAIFSETISNYNGEI
jgi:hypothetical protein